MTWAGTSSNKSFRSSKGSLARDGRAAGVAAGRLAGVLLPPRRSSKPAKALSTAVLFVRLDNANRNAYSLGSRGGNSFNGTSGESPIDFGLDVS